MPRHERRRGQSPLRTGAGLVLLLLAACHRDPAPDEPPVELPASFSSTGTAVPPARWWRTFADPDLDALVAEALGANLDLRQAWSRLDQARAVARRSGAALVPGLDVDGGLRRQVDHRRRVSAPDPGQGTAGDLYTAASTPTVTTVDTYATRFSLGAAVAYELDLWGRVRSEHDAARLDLAATARDLQTAAITLSANLAATWYRLTESRGQLVLLEAQLDTARTWLEVLRGRFRHGRAEATDVLQQEQLVERLNGDRRLLVARAEVLTHGLAVLAGRAPGTDLGVQAPAELPVPPPLPRTGPPTGLLRRRPDLRAAELRLQAADSRVRAAIADLFPRLTLSVSGSTSAARFRDLFDNWAASVAGNLVAPLIDGGRRRAEIANRRARLEERLAAYGQAVLRALAEVEDALTGERERRAHLASLERQLDLARRARERIRLAYTRGTTDFLRLLSAVQAHQRLQREILQARRDLLLERIALHRALAGPWTLQRPPPPAEAE